MHLKRKLNFSFNLSPTGKLILFRFSIVVGILIFFTVMVYIPYGINIGTSNYINDDEDKVNNSRSLLRLAMLEKEILDGTGCVYSNCRFYCMNTSTLSLDLKESFEESNCTAIDNLQIRDEFYENNTLGTDYFNFNYTVLELGILNLNLTHINDDVFNKDIFTRTFTLTLEIPNLETLPSGMLLGLTKLKYLTISSSIKNISRAFLQPVRSTLEYIKINYMTEAIEFEEIFGISVMTNLFHLDASKNHFNGIIKQSTFLLLPKLQYLNLADSQIYSIEENAFKPVWMTLKFLDISENKLTQIYDLTIAFGVRPIYMHLRDNDWRCNCKILPLVKIFHRYRDHFMDTPLCKHPQIYYGETINAFKYNCPKNDSKENHSSTKQTRSSVELVEATSPIQRESAELELTTASEIFTTKTVPTKTVPTISSTIKYESREVDETITVEPKNSMLLRCLRYKEFNNNMLVPQTTDMLQLQSAKESIIYVEPPLYKLNITLLTSNSIKVTIQEPENVDVEIIWFSDPSNFHIELLLTGQNKYDYGCTSQERESIIIENLKENTTYTICILPDGRTDITPFHCSPFHVPSTYGFDPPNDYLNHDENAFIIALICLAVVIATSLGGAITFFIVKSYPDLLKGSKKVVVVKKSTDSRSQSIIGEQRRSIKEIPRRLSSKHNSVTSETMFVSPFVVVCNDNEIDSAYETPVDSDFDCQHSIHRESLSVSQLVLPNIFIETPKTPPPLPKRNSEHIYGIIRPPAQPKRSI